MKPVTAYMTNDGTLHRTLREAKHYADERVGAVIVEHAHKLVRLNSYSDVVSYLENNATALAKLAELIADRDNLDSSED